MIIYLILGALAVLYLVFFRKKPAITTASVPAAEVAAVPVPERKLFSVAAQGLKDRLRLEDSNRPITISLKNVELLSHNTYNTELPSLVRAFEELAHVYIIVQTSSDEEDHLVRQKILELIPEFPVQRCLVFSLEVGKTAIVRQVIPSIHIDHDKAFCEKMKPHVRKLIWVDGGVANVSVSAGLDALDSTCSPSKHDGPQSHGNGAGNASGLATVNSLGEILSLRLG